MTGPHPEHTTGHRDLAHLRNDLAAAIAEMTRHLLPLLHRITAHRQHLDAAIGPRTAARQQAARRPSAGHLGPTTRLRAPQRLDATGTAPTGSRRAHRYRRFR